MSSKNNENSAAASAIVFIAMGILAIGLFIAAALAFLCFVLTILCLFAWNNPVRIGRLSILPADARAFLFRGVIGLWLVPAFVLFCDALFKLGVVWGYLPYMMMVGYVGGSLGLELLFAGDDKPATAEPDFLPPAQQIPERSDDDPSSPWQRPKDKPFNYASWDDDDETRR